MMHDISSNSNFIQNKKLASDASIMHMKKLSTPRGILFLISILSPISLLTYNFSIPFFFVVVQKHAKSISELRLEDSTKWRHQ